jgi:hypothetical protein
MNAPRRLIDEAKTPAERVIAAAASVAPQPMRSDGWDDVMALAVTRQQSVTRLVPAFVLSVALGIALVMLSRPVPVAPTGTIAHASAGTRWSSVAPDEVVLQSGRLSVATPSGAPLRVRTPDAVLDVTRCSFLAEVVAGGTTIWVEQGELILRANDTVRVVHAGESLTWPPSPEIPGPLLQLPPATDSRCATLAPGPRRACLQTEAAGSSLEAQAALYELGTFETSQGQLDAGLRAWRESLDRFPEGVLHPEVRLALLIELVKARRFADARDAARDFETHCAGDPRLGDVKSLQRGLH